MKLALLLALAAAASAQVPAHSVSGTLTIDIADVQVPVPYGTTETKAVISVCSSAQVSRIQVAIAAVDSNGILMFSSNYDVSTTNVANGYCASMVAPDQRIKLTQLTATAANQANIFAPSPSAATSGSMAARQR
jgi:hypothetical protein